MTVTPKDKLFHAIPWSYGTLGFLTAVELRVIPASKYVRHRYIPVYSTIECVKKWTELQTSKDSPDFLEGFMYSKTEGVIMAGYYHHSEPTTNGPQLNNINWWYKPYFYKHAYAFVQKRQIGEELIPLRQYYQRHNRSIFWALEDQVPMCHNPVFRFALGWALPPRVPFLKLIESPSVTEWYEEKYVLQDFMVPLDKMLALMNLCHKELAVYPLWLCPYKVPNNGPMQGKVKTPPGTKHGQGGQYVDCAAVGKPLIADFDCAKAIRTLEEFLRDNDGIQGNYSYTYQTIQEFRQMFDHSLYDEVRKELGAEKAFPEGYEKLARKNQWRAKPLPPLLAS
jgi:delta24-sterol reductase